MGEYDDLLYLPHPVSRKHPPMSAMDRAAQFSPFSALTGYEAVLQEAGRLTDSRAELTEYSRDILDQKQQILLDAAPAHPEITVTCFIPDRRKQGGAYGTLKGNLKKNRPQPPYNGHAGRDGDFAGRRCGYPVRPVYRSGLILFPD
ncbi:MAG: hypothetical protein ACLTR8_04800 [Oscillospiraceae bacterium]